jgi:hypothetical protein
LAERKKAGNIESILTSADAKKKKIALPPVLPALKMGGPPLLTLVVEPVVEAKP